MGMMLNNSQGISEALNLVVVAACLSWFTLMLLLNGH